MIFTRLLACASADTSVVRWTDPLAWAPLDPATDPNGAHAPEGSSCPAGAWYVERGALEVDTERCPYLWIGQPLQAAIPAGTSVEGLLWHLELTAEAPAVGHAALSFGAATAWEVEVPIPAETGFHEIRVRTVAPVPPGTVIGFHLHNHGANTWTLEPLEGIPGA